MAMALTTASSTKQRDWPCAGFMGSCPPGGLSSHSGWQQDAQGMGRFSQLPQDGPRCESSSHAHVRTLRFIYHHPWTPPSTLLIPAPQVCSAPIRAVLVHIQSVPYQPLWPGHLNLLCLVLSCVTRNLTLPHLLEAMLLPSFHLDRASVCPQP